MIDPRIYTDVDGRYVGGDYKIHTADSTLQNVLYSVDGMYFVVSFLCRL